MEGDKTADSEKELTSTSNSDMGKLLSTNKEEKNDSNDTLPTSSTDASTSVKSTHLVSDDPISSTSSEMDNARCKTGEKTSTDVLDKDLLDMSMAAQPTEKIEENVDDLVSDLETLLGEATTPLSLPSKAGEEKKKTEASSAEEEITELLVKSEDEVSSNTEPSYLDQSKPTASTKNIEEKDVTDKVNPATLEVVEENANENIEGGVDAQDSNKGSEGLKPLDALSPKENIDELPDQPFVENREENTEESNIAAYSKELEDKEVLSKNDIVDYPDKDEEVENVSEVSAEDISNPKISLISEEEVTEGIKAKSEQEKEILVENIKCDETVNIKEATEAVDSAQTSIKLIENVSEESVEDISSSKTSLQLEEDITEGIKTNSDQENEILVENIKCETTKEILNITESSEAVDTAQTSIKVIIPECGEAEIEKSSPEQILNIGESNIPQNSKDVNKDALQIEKPPNIEQEEPHINIPESLNTSLETEQCKDHIELENQEDGESNKEENRVRKDNGCDSEEKEKEICQSDETTKEKKVVDIDDCREPEEKERKICASDETIEEAIGEDESYEPKAQEEREILDIKNTDNLPIEEQGNADKGEENIIQKDAEDQNSQFLVHTELLGMARTHDQPKTETEVTENPDAKLIDLKEDKNEDISKDILNGSTDVKKNNSEKLCTECLDVSDAVVETEVHSKEKDSLGCILETEISSEINTNESTDESVSVNNDPENVGTTDLLEKPSEDKLSDKINDEEAQHAFQTAKTTDEPNQGSSLQCPIDTPVSVDEAEIIALEPKIVEPKKSETFSTQKPDVEITDVDEDKDDSVTNVDATDVSLNDQATNTDSDKAEFKDILQPSESKEDINTPLSKNYNDESISELVSKEDKKENIQSGHVEIKEHEKGAMVSVEGKEAKDREENNLKDKLQGGDLILNKHISDDQSKLNEPEKQEDNTLHKKMQKHELTFETDDKKDSQSELREQKEIPQISVEKKGLDGDVLKETVVPNEDIMSHEVVSENKLCDEQIKNNTEVVLEKEEKVSEKYETQREEGPEKNEDKTSMTIIQDCKLQKSEPNADNMHLDLNELPADCENSADNIDMANKDTHHADKNKPEIKTINKEACSKQNTEALDNNESKEGILESLIATAKSVKAPELQHINANLIMQEPSAKESNPVMDSIKSEEKYQKVKNKINIDQDKIIKNVLNESARVENKTNEAYSTDRDGQISICKQSEKVVASLDNKNTDKQPGKIKAEQKTEKTQDTKPISEINIRRKTVEQDLEKVVCLSEESSDSDTNDEIKTQTKPGYDVNIPEYSADNKIHSIPSADDYPQIGDDDDLIQVAQEAEQRENTEIIVPSISGPSEESVSVIDNIFSSQQISMETQVNTQENLETILAVASLQNEPVSEVRLERRLSEKELREMEAIRMAVASITDSSQDTYDSFLVESSMTMEESIQEISSDVQEISSDVPDISSDTQELPSVQEVSSDGNILRPAGDVPDISSDTPELPTVQEVSSDGNILRSAGDVPDILSDTQELLTVQEVSSDGNILRSAGDVPDISSDTQELPTVQEVSSDGNILRSAGDVPDISSDTQELPTVQDVSNDGKILKPADKEAVVPANVDEIKEDKEEIESCCADDKNKDIVRSNLETSIIIENEKDEPLDKSTDAIIANIPEKVEVNEALKTESVVEISKDDVLKHTKVSLTEEIIEHKAPIPSPLVKDTLICEPAKQAVAITSPLVKENLISEPARQTETTAKDDVLPKEIAEQEEVLPATELVVKASDSLATEIVSKQPKSTPIVEKESLDSKSTVDEIKALPQEQPVNESDSLATEIVSEQPKSTQIDEKESLDLKSTIDKIKTLPQEQPVKEIDVPALQQVPEERSLRHRTRRGGNKVSEPLSINVEELEKREKSYSPKITVKPLKVPDEEVSTTSDAEGNKGSLKITITKQSDKMHSILKVYNPDDDTESATSQEEPIPKLIIKPKMQQVEQQHSPKMSTRSSKVYSPTSTQRCSSPRVTIKPIVKPPEIKTEAVTPLKITIKPVVNSEESGRKHSPKTLRDQDYKSSSPKITIKPIPKPAETEKDENIVTTPKVTIKPIKRHIEDDIAEYDQERSSPKITIKPVVKPTEQDIDSTNQTTPKIKIKPIKRQEDEENTIVEKERDSPKISIKPIVNPAEEEEEEVKERIVLKINKGNLPTPSKESRKREYPEDDKNEKMGKLKLKFSTTGGQTHIVQEVDDSVKRQRKDSGYSGKKDHDELSNKRVLEDRLSEKNKRLRSSVTPDKSNEDSNDGIKTVDHKSDSPIVISEDSRSQHSADYLLADDSHPSNSSKVVDIALHTTHIQVSPVVTVGMVTPSASPAPKKRGRPRKTPLVIREELTDSPVTPQITPQTTPQTTPVLESSSTPTDKNETPSPGVTTSSGGRPKRSCRGQNVIATLGIKPRKPRGGGKGRGSKVNMGDREPVVQTPIVQTSMEPAQTIAMKPEKEPKLTKAKQKLIQKAAEEESKKQKDEDSKKQKNIVSDEERDEHVLRKLKENERQEQEGLLKQEELPTQGSVAEKCEKYPKTQEEQKRLQVEQKDLVLKIKDEKIEKRDNSEVQEAPQKEQGEIVKQKIEQADGQAPLKKKKEDKTPPRKLEVTTRRQKAQLQKAAEEAEKVAVETQKESVENKKTDLKIIIETPKNINLKRKSVTSSEETSSANTSANDTVIILTDEDSSELVETQNRVLEEKDKQKEKVKKTPELKGKGKGTPEKAKKAKLEEDNKVEEAKRAEALKKEQEQKQAELKQIEELKKDEEVRKTEELKKAEQLRKAEEQQKAELQKKAEEAKRAAEELETNKAAEIRKIEKEKQEVNAALSEDIEQEATAEDKRVEEVSAEDDEESEDSEIERQRELVKLKKQEAIKKCRAKRMEKLAKAAELKRKRQEQAAQQRAAKIAADEAERIAAEKSRISRRYGRYGNPKPQISLIDEPVRETDGTVKSHMGLFNPETEQVMITQPILVDDDSSVSSNQQSVDKPMKTLEISLTPLSTTSQKLLAPEPMVVDSTEETPTKHRRPLKSEDVMMVDEETRMSADFRGSRAQTPAKQGIPPPESIIEDSQGSVGTESGGGKSKSTKTPKMEVFQDLEANQVSAEQLAEYSWGGRGPFMIQEQVALFLGIKSFKRKYPNCQRRPVDMQERDYLKENGYVTEAQCDLGLTAVNAQDILDIMYADFQDKYEDYCKAQREKQARELANKQKALSQFTFKPGYEKLDIIEQAVQSAAAWNQQFNKARREERKAHMDLQNFTVHYPKSKRKVVSTSKIGHHPIALVPGQFTDYYKEFTPTELNNLPLNTMCYDEIKVPTLDSDSDESSSGSDSDSDSSSGSSDSDSSCNEDDCKECVKHSITEASSNINDIVMENSGSNDSVVLVSVTAAPSVTA